LHGFLSKIKLYKNKQETDERRESFCVCYPFRREGFIEILSAYIKGVLCLFLLIKIPIVVLKIAKQAGRCLVYFPLLMR